MISWLKRDDDAPRPPLAGRLIGLAVGVLVLSGAVYVAASVVQALIPLMVPLVVLIGIYAVMFGKHRK
ncbi:hypothetical protein [Amycolatopsis sp. cmx-8-4]|uniref:hypothetical protein n=1 Tax=Amycolatopsis sp. cmx-8-4 TaxID=2790947 RepID=UPI00397BA35F